MQKAEFWEKIKDEDDVVKKFAKEQESFIEECDADGIICPISYEFILIQIEEMREI